MKTSSERKQRFRSGFPLHRQNIVIGSNRTVYGSSSSVTYTQHYEYVTHDCLTSERENWVTQSIVEGRNNADNQLIFRIQLCVRNARLFRYCVCLCVSFLYFRYLRWGTRNRIHF